MSTYRARRRSNFFLPFIAMAGLFIITLILLVRTSSLLEAERNRLPEKVTFEIQATPVPSPTPEPIPDDELLHVVETANPYNGGFTEEDVELLARLLTAESGPTWPNWAIMTIGEVVMNRVESPEFPDTLHDVIYQTDPVQYAPVFASDWDSIEVSREMKSLARRLLMGERPVGDPAMVFQALFSQGSRTVVSFYDTYLGSTTYFCEAYNMSLYE